MYLNNRPMSGDRIPVGARFSANVQTGPGAHPASYTMVTGSFPEVKRQGRGIDHPPPSSAVVKERVDLYLYPPSGPSWPVLGRALPFTYLHVQKSLQLKLCDCNGADGDMITVTYCKSQERNFDSGVIRVCAYLRMRETHESVSGVLSYCWFVYLCYLTF